MNRRNHKNIHLNYVLIYIDRRETDTNTKR